MNTKPQIFRIIAASSIGTILEWYDFSLFGYLTPILAKLFFPLQNSFTALMLTYAVFAVGFFVRPIGAIVFGHFGDKFGRKKTLVSSILLMSIPTFLIGVLPTYQAIGLTAPILLIILRILQGFSVGGESTGASIFVLETISDKRRGFIGGLLWGMTAVGMLLGSFAVSFVVSHPEYSWLWRVPFLFGLVTGVVGYFLRKRTLESQMFLDAQKQKTLSRFPLRDGFKKHKNSILVLIGLYILSAIITYLIFIFMPTYAKTVAGLPLGKTSTVSSFAFLISILGVSLSGYLSDRVGRKICLVIGATAFLILSYPLFLYVSTGQFSHYLAAEIVFALLAALYQGVLTATAFEMLSTPVRFSGMAFCLNMSYSLFGGAAPFVATSLVQWTGNKAAPGLYLTLGAMIALLALFKYKQSSQIVFNKSLSLVS